MGARLESALSDGRPDDGAERSEKPRMFEAFQEADGTASVLFPSAIWPEHGYVGALKKSFDSLDEAQDAAVGIREELRQQYDMSGFEKAFGNAAVIPTEDGKFFVLEDQPNGKPKARAFDTWQDARDHYIEQQPDLPSDEAVIELSLGSGEKTVFSKIDQFRPNSVPTQETYPVPDDFKAYVDLREADAAENRNYETYRKSIAEKGWEEKTFRFVEKYLDGRGAELRAELGIEDLRKLSPEQAVQLSTRLAIDLHKYSRQDAESDEKDGDGQWAFTDADQSTALQLLEAGYRKVDEFGWEGNGICRNVASSIKVVFEALKARQVEYSRLNNTYALVESSWASMYKVHMNDKYSVQRMRGKSIKPREPGNGHAWNSFVTISREGGATGTIVDATWGRGDLDRGKETKGDYTETRMEPMVYALARKLSPESPDYDREVQQVLDFYDKRLRESTGPDGDVTPTEASAYYSSRAMSLIDNLGLHDAVPDALANSIAAEYQPRMHDQDPKVLERLWGLGQGRPDFPMGALVDQYVSEKDMASNDKYQLKMRDDELQREVFRSIIRKDGPERFVTVMNETPDLRIRMRGVFPEAFGEFRPDVDAADAKELALLAYDSRLLRGPTRGLLISGETLDAAKMEKLHERIATTLRRYQPERADEIIAAHPLNELVQNFDRLAAGSS